MWSTCSIETGHSRDAGAAGDAVPDDVVGDRVRHQRRDSALAAASSSGPSREQLVAQPHDQQLRRQLLAGRVGRADVLAAAALGARERVDHLLPGQVGDRPGAEAGSRLGHVLVEAQRLEPAARARAPEEDVDRRGDDVQVLRVGQVGEEAEDEQHVRPDEARARASSCRAPSPNRFESAFDDRRPARPATRSGRARSATACQQQQRESRCPRSAPGSGRPRPGGCPRTAPAAAPCGSRTPSTTPTSTSTANRSTRNANQPCGPEPRERRRRGRPPRSSPSRSSGRGRGSPRR